MTGGTAILAKASNSGVHAVSYISGVSAGALLQLGGTGGDQIYDGNFGVEAMNGTFDFNGQTEGIPTLAGAGTVTNTPPPRPAR